MKNKTKMYILWIFVGAIICSIRYYTIGVFDDRSADFETLALGLFSYALLIIWVLFTVAYSFIKLSEKD